MSFFIPGRTTGAICERSIEHRWQAARLPFADPEQVAELAALARRFVHRDCWQRWEARGRYSAAAMSLILRRRDEHAGPIPLASGPGIVWFDVPALRGFRVEDLNELITLEIPRADSCGFARWLEDAAADNAVGEVIVGADAWRLERAGLGVELTRSQAGERIEVVTMNQDRLDVWATVVRSLCDKTAIASTGSAP